MLKGVCPPQNCVLWRETSFLRRRQTGNAKIQFPPFGRSTKIKHTSSAQIEFVLGLFQQTFLTTNQCEKCFRCRRDSNQQLLENIFLINLFLFTFMLLSSHFKYKLKKRRCCAWGSNPGPQDGRRRRSLWASYGGSPLSIHILKASHISRRKPVQTFLMKFSSVPCDRNLWLYHKMKSSFFLKIY